MNKYDGMDLINGSGEGKNPDITKLREEFKSKYINEKGWDFNNLSEEQLNEIKSQKGYQCPGMICG
ncbi:MAG: hypothetical protein SLAVMIC_00792 [uncultured marine phage]|uniref:Uncharacterized protein n=1 Tax=uncultured marine phage TaxID=707152 RepID=A0A8D9FRD9_9VIRU|nr:MAG: hypothetical protein SLAVMIC_00792 [uncultured marine phage]